MTAKKPVYLCPICLEPVTEKLDDPRFTGFWCHDFHLSPGDANMHDAVIDNYGPEGFISRKGGYPLPWEV
jgi:hypothetical protein